jgi:hypothetical protein
MKTVLLFCALLAATGCRPVPSQDEVRFDSLLATGRIDHVVFAGGPYHLTNGAWNRTCELYLRLMNATNRVSAQAPNLTNPATGRVLFYSGSNVLGGFGYHRTEEVLAFGTYSFRLKEATNYYQWFSP